jgi:hypothetical protein
MPATNVPDDHHFVKFFKQRELIRENGAVIGVHPFAFELRKPTGGFAQEKTLSGVYYEFFLGAPIEMLIACYHFIQMTIKARDALVRMHVGLTREQGRKRSRSLRVRHEPETACLAYAEIHGLPVDTMTNSASCWRAIQLLRLRK